MRFEWDAIKALTNVAKHNVSFKEATEVFSDPNALEGYDTLHSTNETRFSIIGFSSRRLLYVVYAERSTDIVRLISARKANQAERKIYERRINR
jgi:uncharacterized protein